MGLWPPTWRESSKLGWPETRIAGSGREAYNLCVMRASVLAAMLAVFAALGCQRDEAVFVNKIMPPEVLPMGLASEVALEPVQQALQQAGFVMSSGSKRNSIAKVELLRLVSADSRTADRWQMRLFLAPREINGEGGLAVPMEGAGEVNATEAVPSRSELEAAAALAASELAAERKLMLRPHDEIARALQSDSKRLRDFAIRVAGMRRQKALVEPLTQRLQTETEGDLVLRIVGALVQIGDERAVGPLVELTKKRHPVFVNQIVFAVASIGGAEAEAYLDTMAQGHPSEHVRQAAKEALSELLSRKRSATTAR